MKATTEAADAAPTEEPCNVAINVLKNRTKVGKAICGAGPCTFPVTKTMADQLVALGLAEIIGSF